MKKTNSKNSFDFNKSTITELNDNQLHQVNGGTMITTFMSNSIIIYTGGEDGQYIKITR
jgi:hypothetical protein